MDQKFKFGGFIGFGTSCWDSLFRFSKVFSLHARLHDAVGAVRSHSGKGPGYCYMIGRGPNSCVLNHVTGLLFCLYVKLFLPSIFISIDFWSSMSLIVLDIELTQKNIIKELRLFIDGSLQGFSFCPPKTFKTHKQTTWSKNHQHEIAWSSGKLDYEKLFAVFYDIEVGMQKRLLKDSENVACWQDLSDKIRKCRCLKIQDLIKTDSSCMCSSCLSRHKTRLNYAERKAKV